MLIRLIKLGVSLAVAIVDGVNTTVARLLDRPPRTICVVLYYHAIRAEMRRQFAVQMDDLLRLSAPIDIEDSEELPRGTRSAAITFDDGFVSVIENALPELSTRGIPCAIFVPTGCIGSRPSWIELSHYDADERVASAEALKAIAQQPLVRIGSHSVSHPNFRQLDDSQASNEFISSKEALEKVIGRRVASFSFPHGAHTTRCLELARQCGYQQVFTIEPVPLTATRKPFVIGRVRVEPDDWPIEFRLKLAGAYRWMPCASALKHVLVSLVRRNRAAAPQLREEL